jgi:hypothetical protein
MKVSEVILPKQAPSDNLHARRQRRIDMLKDRIQTYAERLYAPNTSRRYADFLKSKILSDGKELEKLSEKQTTGLTEAVHRLPLTEADFDNLKTVMSRPVPVIVAHIYLQDLIDDDELSGQLGSLEQTDPAADARDLIADWVKRVMPDQLYRFQDQSRESENGEISPVHGYDSCMYRGTVNTMNGKHYNRF